MRAISLIWQTFWQLTVIWEWETIIEKNWRKRKTSLCKCSCWKTITVRHYSLKSGGNKSCWCLKKSLLSNRNKEDHPMFGMVWDKNPN